MRLHKLSTLAVAVLLAVGFTAKPSSASVVQEIIDGSQTTTDGDGYTLNGSFESYYDPGVGNSQQVPVGWEVAGYHMHQSKTRNNIPVSDGSYALVVSDPNNDTDDGSSNDDGQGGLINTGYNVKSGDTFDLSFHYKGAWRWDSDDAQHWRLLTTSDDTTSGTITEIASGSVDGFNNGDIGSVSEAGIGSIDAPSVGQDLWLELYALTNGGDTDGTSYSRIDEVNLAANTIPEPASASLALIGLGCTVLAQRRPARRC
jgi:hypothetical protein